MMRTILLVDDDQKIRSLYKAMLSSAEHRVIEAQNGKEGLQLFSKHAVDIVITDILMPEMEGLEFILQLHKKDPQVMIIAISGGGFNSPDEYLPIAKAFGARHTFQKPVKIDDLLAAINEHVLQIHTMAGNT